MERGEPIRYAQAAFLPYAPELIFDMVADVERYPEFLQEYRAVRIRSRDGDILYVDQVIGFSAIELTLSAVAKLRRPVSIIVYSDHDWLGALEIRWAFEPAEAGTRVDFQMALTPPSRFAASLAEYLLTRSASRTLQAFVEHAEAVYGRGRDFDPA